MTQVMAKNKDKHVFVEDDFEFRDLNKNGRLDPYEDNRLPIEERIEDLLGQMSRRKSRHDVSHDDVG